LQVQQLGDKGRTSADPDVLAYQVKEQLGSRAIHVREAGEIESESPGPAILVGAGIAHGSYPRRQQLAFELDYLYPSLPRKSCDLKHA
jgi:hypothetical protein